MLFYGARTNAQLGGDLLIAAALYQQLQNLFIARRDLDLVNV
jgi:hypothetical protein